MNPVSAQRNEDASLTVTLLDQSQGLFRPISAEEIKELGHIGILMGGYSSEREISLKSGRSIYDTLKDAGCRLSLLDIVFQEEEKISSLIRDANIDVAFIALHGRLGEDGTIQNILEGLQIPYAGSGVEASKLAINKIKTQSVLRKKGVPVAEHVALTEDQPINPDEVIRRLGLPVVVKPACEGSSIGVKIVKEKENLEVAIDDAFRYGKEVLIERFIPGREVTVGILDRFALPVIEILPQGQFFDFTSKYQKGMTNYVVPAQFPLDLMERIQHIAMTAHEALGCRHFSRVDLIVDGQGIIYVLELNTIPGFTSMSLLPKAALAVGIDFMQLCLKLIFLANEKKDK